MLAISAGVPSASAQVFTWGPSTNSGLSNWSVTNNWVGTTPSNGSVGRFDWTSASNNLASSNNLSNLVMTTLMFSNIDAVTLTGNAITLSNASGGISNRSTSLQTISFQGMTMATAFNINALSNSIVVNSPITNGGNLLTITASTNGYVTLAGSVSGSGGLTKMGAGTLYLDASNSHTGNTVISNGTIHLRNSYGLGATNGTTIVTSAGTLLLEGNINTPETLTVGGLGNASLGILRNMSGSNVISGDVSLTANSRIRTEANSRMEFSGAFNLNGFTNAIYSLGETVFSGPISGSGSLSKLSNGLTILSGNNSYTGTTTVSGGTLRIAHNNALGATNGATTVGNGFTLEFSNNISVVGEAMTITGVGVGTNGALRNIHGDNTNTGTMTLTTARIQTEAGTSFMQTGDITAPSTLTVNSLGVTTISGKMSGAGGLTKLGVGTLNLSGSNSYTGTTTVSAGTLRISHNNALGATNKATTVANGATLELSNNITTPVEAITVVGAGVGGTGGLRNIHGTNTLGGSLTLNTNALVAVLSNTTLVTASNTVMGAGTTTFASDGNTLLNGVVSGTSILVKSGAGTLTFNAANTFTNSLVISSGTVQVGNGTNAGSIGSAVKITNNGALVYRVAAGGRTNNGIISGTGSLTLDSPGGSLRLGGTNTYTGGTTVVAGQLNAVNFSSLGSGSLTLAGTNAANKAEVAYIVPNTALSVGAISLQGNSVISLLDRSSVVGTGALTLSGTNNYISLSGSSWLEGTNTLVSGTSLSTNTGSWIRLTGATFGGAELALGGSTNVGRSLFTFGSNATSYYLSVTGVPAEILWTGASNNTWNTNSTNWVLAPGGVASSTNSIFIQNDTVYFGSNATATNIIISSSVSAGHMFVTNTNGTVRFGGGTGVLSVEGLNKTGAGNLVITNVLDIRSGGVLSNTGSGNVTLAGAWTNGALVQAGTGTVTLAVSNSFAGGVTISNGTVTASASRALGSGDVIVSGGTLLLGTTTQVVGDVTLNNGTIDSTTGTLSSASGFLLKDGTVNVRIGGAGALVKDGTGTVSLNRTANAFTGGTTVLDGKLVTGTNNALGTGTVTVSGGIMDIGTFGQTNLGLVTLEDGVINGTGLLFSTNGFAVESGTINARLGGSVALTKNTAGTVTLTGSNSFTGGVVLNEGTLVVGDNTHLGATNGAITFGGSGTLSATSSFTSARNVIFSDDGAINTEAGVALNLTGTQSGSGDLVKSGSGTLVLSMLTNSRTGDTTISGGVLQVGDGGTAGDLGSGNVVNNASLVINRSDALPISGDISGTGSLTQAGSGTTTLTGDGTYTGGTVINAGVLVMGDGATSGSIGSGNMTNNSAFVINRGDSVTINNNITGSGSLTNAGSGTITLTGNGTYSGQTVLQSGTLVLSNTSGNAISGSSITIASGATLELAASNQIGDTTDLILNGGTLRTGTASAGFSEILGTLTLSASSTIDLGSYAGGLRTLKFADSSAITWNTNAVLTITNWQGTEWTPSDFTQIFFGTGGLNSSQLAQIHFANQDIQGGYLYGNDGELVPVPEPRVIISAALLVVAVFWRERRRILGWCQNKASHP